MLKKIFNFTLYSLTALIACFFSLTLALNFLTPAFSQTSSPAQEELTFKKVFSDIFSNFKLILSDLKPEKKEEIKPNDPSPKSDSNNNHPTPPDSFEGDVEGVTVPNNEVLEEEYGDMPPQGDVEEGQLSDRPPQGDVEEGQPLDTPPQGDVEDGQPLDTPSQGDVEEGQPSTPPQGDVVDEGQPLVQNNEEEQLPSEISLEIQSDMAPFIYETPTSRSPFEDPTRKDTPGKVVSTKGEVKVVVPKTPPEMYNLSEIKLKGIIWNIQSPKALFEMPSGEGHYTLIKGDKIGKNGLIFEIREDEVVIVETYYKGSEDSINQTAEQVIKIKKMDRLKLNERK